MEEFLKINRKFLARYQLKSTGQKLLIEEMGKPMITHLNAIYALILNQAKGYQPVWLDNNKYDSALIQSYFPGIQPVKNISVPWLWKIYASFIALAKFPKIFFTKDILSFSFDRVKYGDIVYDDYLIMYKVSTIKRINWRLMKVMAICIFRHLKIKKILKREKFAGVLVSHQVGVRSGILLRTALRYGYHGYLRFDSILCEFQKLEEIYDYPLKPSPLEVDKIIEKLGSELETVFQQILERHVAGLSTKDGLHAFDKNHHLYFKQQDFNEAFNLPTGQKNIFVMLHAFTDNPHSHFKWMIFKDYYDWFYQTLQFAKKHPEYNWIFKQHPSVKYYYTGDVDFAKLFTDCPSNIVYLDNENQIDTRSLIYCADLVVTCLGSAGFEIPAMGGIPSITAADNFYTGLGFALEPKNQTDYFNLLSRTDKINKLTPEQQQRAKATFIYIREYALPSVSFRPKLTFDEEKDRKINDWYWPRVENIYLTQKERIIKEIDDYIETVKLSNFKKLTSLDKLLGL